MTPHLFWLKCLGDQLLQLTFYVRPGPGLLVHTITFFPQQSRDTFKALHFPLCSILNMGLESIRLQLHLPCGLVNKSYYQNNV